VVISAQSPVSNDVRPSITQINYEAMATVSGQEKEKKISKPISIG